MVPPRWADEHGRPIPTYPCPRCGLEVASRFKGFRVAYLLHVGWQLCRAETYVNWCRHGQEVIPLPLPDGRVTFVPVLGEANSKRASLPPRRLAYSLASFAKSPWGSYRCTPL
jgi:hypothetical protein